MSQSQEYYAAQVGFASEAELDQANYEIDMAQMPRHHGYTEEELAEMLAEHEHFLATRQQGIAAVNPHLAEARGA